MSASDDLVSYLKGNVNTLAQFVAQAISPGWSLSTTTSPKATIFSTVSTVSQQVIGANAFRRHIEFFNTNAVGTTIFLMPGNATAVINQGIPIGTAGSYIPQTWLNVTGAFNAIASSNATSVLTIVEFF